MSSPSRPWPRERTPGGTAVGWVTLAPLLFAACAGPPARGGAGEAGPGTPPGAGPYVLVLGTAQDAGVPQIGCAGPHCTAAREDPARARTVTSLLLVDPRHGRRWLFDATPDLPLQLERCVAHPPNRELPGARPALFEGIFLTHAHMGHYAGLLHLGPEAYGAQDVPLFVSPRMGTFLESNGPWSLLVERGIVRLEEIAPGGSVRLAPDLGVTAIPVPHREEFSDTYAFLIEGPERSLLYMPDIDKWERWETRIEDVLARVDVALLDGAFFDDGEIPGRDLASIPHPFIVESLARFAQLGPEERAKVRFTHLNHTNPATDPDSEEAARVRSAGMAVAADGERHRL